MLMVCHESFENMIISNSQNKLAGINSLLRNEISRLSFKLLFENWFDQRVDHGDFSLGPEDSNGGGDDDYSDNGESKKSQETFKQLFFVNDVYYKPGGPILLFLYGESPASESFLFSGNPIRIAKELGAMLIIMEHRYYGKSFPVPDMSGPNMKYLTLKNSLKDIEYFIRNVHTQLRSVTSKDIKPAPETKWILYGGSYGGMLAVWARKLFPDIVSAAYASSAPIQVKYEFPEFDAQVGKLLPCSQKYAKAVQQFDEMIDRGNRTEIDAMKRKFGLEKINDNTSFAGAFVDYIVMGVQFHVNKPSLLSSLTGEDDSSYGIICEYFDNPSPDDKTELDSLSRMQYENIKQNNIDVIKAYDLRAQADNYSIGQSSRAWYWQICTEFGFWQISPTMPNATRYRPKLITLESEQAPCQWYFGLNKTQIAPHDRDINSMLGGWYPDVNRTVFVNPLMDPWLPLTTSSPLKPARTKLGMANNDGGKDSSVVIEMKHGSHVVDLYVNEDDVVPGMDKTIREVVYVLKGYLSD
ncbi:hypothetical protein H4219_005056 [Mycoemilia scoparia]|uniref:Uncharacterized protein n=1 Tax=Mycoemilia scoparia TaxID=417184 RepID=A0A9W8DQ99_9FUNG|nr:hypothetical protein H4219_005056 [Mycoemilia scoparia]